MSFTDADTVKKHLLGFAVNRLVVKNLEVELEESEVQLPHRSIETGSVRVAQVLESAPSGPVQITLNGTNWYPVGSTDLLTGSVSVAPDTQPSEFYVEGEDYSVDHEAGNIRRIDGGGIASGDTVYVWYIPLTVYEEDTDYELDYAEGEIVHLPEGSLPIPARLLVDYRTTGAGVTDSLVSQAITEAEDKILARLKYEGSEIPSEQGLSTGATELTLSVLCDDLALQTLGSAVDTGADDRARRFMELARRYEERAAATLARFLTTPLLNEPRRKANPSDSFHPF